ncbi:MAG: alpha-glucosidase C-terminal domain-containing protein [Ignavibacteria bacterium]|nr:alpha-glucosidase C-terminal domain-containing protein [Ignavibacteria bacterium]
MSLFTYPLAFFFLLSSAAIDRPMPSRVTSDRDERTQNNYSSKPAIKSADWVRDAVIYCVYLRSFSPAGTFAALEKRIPELKELGVSVLWLMPIHPIGIKNRKGTLGNPYSVRDYYEVNPEFGTIVEFQQLLNTVHKNDMKLILDLVVNHTAWDSKLIKLHPEWFTKDAQGNIVSPRADWTDVADLDYSKQGLRKYMMTMMEWWTQDIGVDGFRCDAAELVPIDFWEEARARLNKIKPVMMLSDGSLPQHHFKAFDLTYSWNLYGALNPLLKGTRPATALDTILNTEASQFPTGSLRLRFNTNQVKTALEGSAMMQYEFDERILSTVLINTISGIPLMYTGDEVANDKELSLFEKVEVDWSKPHEMEDLYKTLFALRREHKALSRGEMVHVPSSDDNNVFTFFRLLGDDRILIALNFSNVSRTVTLQIPFDKILKQRKRLSMKDHFTGSPVAIEPSIPLEVTLEPHGFRIFVEGE